MSADWRALGDEIARWQDAGKGVEFWWRDDDARGPDPALARLVALSDAAAVPLALAVIPQEIRSEVLEPRGKRVTVLQHGVDHISRATSAEKKSEFPASEPVDQALARLAQGRAWIAGSRSLPVLVPPWNRISSGALLTRLAGVGYRGLSRFGARGAASKVPGLVQVNTHVDIIDWHGTRGFVGEQAAIAAALAHLQARREARADPAEATGWLSHHLVHDEACWRFLVTLFEFTGRHPTVSWRSAESLFAAPKS